MHTPYEVFVREHQALREGIASLRSAMRTDHAGTSARLAECIDTVQAQLAVHFAFEEADGSKPHLMVAAPALAPAIHRLQREHKEILAVLTQASAGLHAGLSCADASTALTSVLEQLANHDFEEHQLLLSAFRGA